MNKIKETMIMYKKENPSFHTLSNIYINPFTGRLEYKEHITLKADFNTSLTSSERITYYEKINGKFIKK
jgi:hypothetical protein